MKTRDFASKNIRFGRTSPITGPFRLEMYPFLEKPMDAADDIQCKRLVILKASSSMGTVLGQIINTKRIACDVGDQIMVCQTDDDATKWTKTRGREWLESVPDVMRLLKADKYSATNDLWLFRHKFLIITGPGITAAQSDQVRYVQTDESHLDTYPQGRLLEFEKRMGGRWDSQATHLSTAPNEGRELDTFYVQGSQDEWNWRCPKCNGLIWALWEDRAKAHYNGERIFHWKDSQSESETLSSIFVVCPHCQHVSLNTSRCRYALVRDGDYVTMNPTAGAQYRSFRWSAWGGAHWIGWDVFLSEHLLAMNAARQGDLKPHEDFTKKRECMAYRAELPNLGEAKGENNYALGDKWNIPDLTRILTADYQAGKKAEGSHLWALVTEWDAFGNSRRVAYRKLQTWAQLRVMQLELGVRDCNVYIDCGYDDRTVFWQCSIHHWYAVQGSSDQQYHEITVDKGKPTQHKVTLPMPYSQPERQNGNVGAKQPDKLRTELRGALPPGWALKIVMHNPQLYGYLHALQSNTTGKYFGIARDMPEEYTGGFPAFIPVIDKHKKTNVETIIWRKVKPFEHPWDCEVMALVGALRAACFPLKQLSQPITEEKAA